MDDEKHFLHSQFPLEHPPSRSYSLNAEHFLYSPLFLAEPKMLEQRVGHQ
jgi:hypothetical protein